MDVLDLQKSLESLIDWILETDPDEVRDYVDELCLEHPKVDKRKIAEKIINDQSFNNGLLGAVTGLGGLITLPATVPIDIIKAWRIQAFTINCIAYLYGYTPQKTDLKTDIFLVLSNGSLEDVKKLVIEEFVKSAPKQASKSVDFFKEAAIKQTGKIVPKYAAKAITKYGGKKVASYTMKGISKHLTKALWKVGGKKVVEKSLQKSIGKAVPIVGAVVGGSIDWFATQAIGNLAVEYYEKSTPEWMYETFEIWDK